MLFGDLRNMDLCFALFPILLAANQIIMKNEVVRKAQNN